MIILGIETSCDDTALALIETRVENGQFQCKVIQSLVHSQAELHSAYGGVFPTLAKREHGKNLVPLFHKLLIDSGAALEEIAADSNASASSSRSNDAESSSLSDTEFKALLESFKTEYQSTNPDLFESFTHADFLKKIPKIDRIAVTEGPGLEPALWVGINFARMLSALWKIPVVPVNHMEGHVLGSLLPADALNGAWHPLTDLPSPAIALLISGGHTELVLINQNVKIKHQNEAPAAEILHLDFSNLHYAIVGQTLDDAVGEAFDKTARLLVLPYPGGPHISMLSHQAFEEKLPSPVRLPRPMISSKDLDFSFSGLKTAVLYAVRANSGPNGELSDSFKKGLAHEFEMAVSETLNTKLRAAIEKFGARAVIVGGGVSANHMLRNSFEETAKHYGIPLYLPSAHVSGDNALMIALAGAVDARPHGDRALKAEGTKRLGE